MPKIAVITDTDSSLPPQIADKYGIQQVPITIHFEDHSYTSGVDIDDKLLFELVDRFNKLPTTSAPSPSAYSAAYESAFSQGAESIVSICVSSKVSSTYDAALSASENFPGRDITVIDSKNLSMAQGFMAIAAAEAAQRGASKDEVLATISSMGPRLQLFAVLSTLKYLALSGRVGKFVAGMADTFNIKPILTMDDGKLVLLERVRTRNKAVERVLELLHKSLDGKPIERVAILHINDLKRAGEFQKQLCAEFHCPDSILTVEFTPGLSVHAGSGVVGVVVLAGK
ncbi:MAG: DegV family protein [Anaerolineaceae bacterium]|nr:DegV family protein [Anaerolineaceae bacterium]